MSNIIVSKSFEIDPNTEEAEHDFYWEDVHDVALQIIEAAQKKKKCLMWVSAGNIDWRGNSGYGVFDVSDKDSEDFWQHIAGIRGDWTLRLLTDIKEGEDFGAMVYSHDTPTGGMRNVKFMTPAEAYVRLKECEIKRREIMEHYDTYTYSIEQDGRITNEMIHEAIEFAGADVYQDLVESQS